MKFPASRHFLIPRTLPGLVVLPRRYHHAPFERKDPFTSLVIGDSLNSNDTPIWVTARNSFVQNFRFSINRITVKGGCKVFAFLKFEIGNSFATNVRYAHAERNAKDERTNHQTLLKLCIFAIVGVDMQGIMVHGEHAEKRVVILGDRASRPMLVHVTDLKVFETSSKLHFCIPFVYCRGGACPALVYSHLAPLHIPTLLHPEFTATLDTFPYLKSYTSPITGER